jgi:hypothetical protein
MESVWWVFGKLFEKGLVYQGFKVGFCCSVFLLSFDGFLLCFFGYLLGLYRGFDVGFV